MVREDDDGVQLYFDEKAKLHDILLHEEIYWKQCAKAFWLEEGDSNFKYIHAIASHRKKLNHISYLKLDDETIVSNHVELCRILKEYYLEVFIASSSE